jgi:hypothetical protein
MWWQIHCKKGDNRLAVARKKQKELIVSKHGISKEEIGHPGIRFKTLEFDLVKRFYCPFGNPACLRTIMWMLIADIGRSAGSQLL